MLATSISISNRTLSHPFLSPLIQKCTTMDQLKQIHSLFITLGLVQHNFSISKILNFCAISENGNLDYALLVFDQIQTPNTFIWNTMIRGFSSSSQPEKSVFFFTQMLRRGSNPDKHTFPLLLKACSRSRKGNPNQIHAQVLKFGLDSDSFVQNSLISAYANSRDLGLAHQVFEETPQRDPIAWTALIDGYVRNNQAKVGLEVFLRMKSFGVDIDRVTVVSVLCAVGMVGDLRFGRWVHGFYVESKRVKWDVYVGSSLVDMYAKCADCDSAHRVFDEMPQRNVVSWSALIAGYVQCNRFKGALDVFQGMMMEGVSPNHATLTSVLTACAQLGALDQGRWVHVYIDKRNLGLNMSLGTALIDMYGKCGNIDEAFKVFHILPEKDVYPWTAMINGLAMHGHALRSLNLFSHMLSDGVRPNAVTFIGVLCACSHGGLVDQGTMYFDCMKQVYGITPGTEHYGCMVDLLGRAGHLEEALELIENMPMEPTAGVWGALFGACMIHKNFKLGELVGKQLIKLQPYHSGRYVLLANMYSVAQRWNEAAHIRKLMKGIGVEKLPGCSLIEVNGAIHEFVAFSKSHRQSKDIFMMLDEITMQMKLAGYVPNTSLLLFDIDVE